jgi:flagellar export protein FliJ
MKRFQFRLQTVLEHRQRKETVAHLNFGQAQSQLNQALKMLQELEDVREAIVAELTERRVAGHFDPDETHLYNEYLKTIRQCIDEQNIYVADLSSTAEALRLHLVGESQKRQVLDHMKTRAQTDHNRTAILVEQAVTDDVAASRRQYQHQQSGQD